MNDHLFEMRKWFELFNKVDVIIFCVSLSEYDLVMNGEEKCVSMSEDAIKTESM